MVDATNPVVFVRAHDLGLTGTEKPEAIDADRALSARLEASAWKPPRAWAFREAHRSPRSPWSRRPRAFAALDGTTTTRRRRCGRARDLHGNCHRAFALTAAMCLAVAARVEGSVVHECTASAQGDVRLGHPSGILPIAAAVTARDGGPWAERVTVYRTARRLMEGFVRVP